jgi:hypothetical protein
MLMMARAWPLWVGEELLQAEGFSTASRFFVRACRGLDFSPVQAGPGLAVSWRLFISRRSAP